MNLLADEGVERQIVTGLRQAGYESGILLKWILASAMM